jgi:tRNA 2-thiouridine synthesizing protein A
VPQRLASAFPSEGNRHDHRLEDDSWDAGDMGCGELVLELRMRLLAMPGRVLKLVATDAGAPEDIPAYCRMTRHELVHAAPPAYWIRARTRPN